MLGFGSSIGCKYVYW